MPSAETAKLIVSAVIRRDDKVLIFEEENDDGAMRYNLPGGHVEPGETPIEALIREVMEETGLVAKPQAFLQLVTNAWSKNHSVLMCFSVQANDKDVQPEIGTLVRWMTATEVAVLPSDRCVYGIKNAVEKVFSEAALPVGALLLRKAGDPVDW